MQVPFAYSILRQAATFPRFFHSLCILCAQETAFSQVIQGDAHEIHQKALGIVIETFF